MDTSSRSSISQTADGYSRAALNFLFLCSGEISVGLRYRAHAINKSDGLQATTIPAMKACNAVIVPPLYDIPDGK